ncbi:MAG: MFS transporter [Alphaproteobacteria bacterium]|nr:MFS transporter [Alphaproteobacteria bacterium]
MAMPVRERLATPEFRTALFYSVSMSTAAISNPFLGLWLDAKGIGAAQIGTLNAVPIFVMILLNVVVGRVADRASDWRQVIVIGALLAAVTPLALFLATDFWTILVLWALVIIPVQALVPVLDAAAMRMTRRRGSEFALVRVWGTIGFVIVTFLAGLVIQAGGIGTFVPMIVFVALVRGVVALSLPNFRATGGAGPVAETVGPVFETATDIPHIARRFSDFWRPWFFLPLVGTALLQASHMMQMAFGALLWSQAGIADWQIGVLWALGPVSEIFSMLYFNRLSRRFSARHLLLWASILGVVRWAGFALTPPLWGYGLLQILHLATFGLAYLGTVSFIANWTHENIAAEAQGFFMMIRQIAIVAALAGFGFLVAEISTDAFWVASAVSGVAALCIAASLVLMSPKKEMEARV